MSEVIDSVRKGAFISECNLYRYWLTREWGEGGNLMAFVMLNPSTADANIDDPTIRRCVGFAKREGRNGIVVVNLFAGRATDPDEMFKMRDPVGPDMYDSDTGKSLKPLHVEDVSEWTDRKNTKLIYTEAVKGPIVQLNMDGSCIHYFYKGDGGRKMIAEDTRRFGFQPGELLALVDRYAPGEP